MGESVEGRGEETKADPGEAEREAEAPGRTDGGGAGAEGGDVAGDQAGDQADEQEERKLGAKAEIEDLGGWKRAVRIEVPAEGVKAEYEERLRELSRNTMVHGFRKGRAPRWRILKQYGESLADEVKLKLVTMATEEVFKEHDLEPVSETKIEPVKLAEGEEATGKPGEEPAQGGKPAEEDGGGGEGTGADDRAREQIEAFKDIELDLEGPLTFQVTMEVKPSFELPNYEGLELVRRRREVTDERVRGLIDYVRREEADYVAVEEGGARAGDRLNVTGHIEVPAEPPEGEAAGEAAGAVERIWEGENEICFLLERGLAGLPAVAEREVVEGMAPGEERTVKAVVADSFKDEKHRGKEAKLAGNLEELKRPELPPLTDESARKYGFDDAEGLTSAARARLDAQAEADAREDLEKQVIDSLVGAVDFALPEAMLEREARSREARQVVRLAEMGIAPDQLEERLRDEIRTSAREASERGLKARLVLGEIAEAEKIEVTDDDVEEEIFRYAQATRSTPVRVRSRLERDGLIDSVREELGVTKVVNFIMERADIRDEPAEGARE